MRDDTLILIAEMTAVAGGFGVATPGNLDSKQLEHGYGFQWGIRRPWIHEASGWEAHLRTPESDRRDELWHR